MRRREFISQAAIATVSAPLLARPASCEEPPDLLEVARKHVQLAEDTRGRVQLWGRLGGSEAERASARLFAKQLRPFVAKIELEPFAFAAYRPTRWSVRLRGSNELPSAVPTPFDARFPDGRTRAPLHLISNDSDWKDARGRFAFVEAAMQGSVYRNSIRESNGYRRAVEAEAAGLIFSLPMKPGRWRAVAPIDKAYAVRDEAYPDKRRPIPCFVVDAEDGAALRAGRDTEVEASIDYESGTRRQAFNVVGYLTGMSRSRIVIFNHLDSFFSGANDNASGIATTVGLAQRLAMLPREKRLADFVFAGLSAHHDGGEGMRAFRARDPKRYASLTHAILIEHTDARGGREADVAGWPASFNDQRTAYLRGEGWSEVRTSLSELVERSGVMRVVPSMVDGCIGDLLAICGEIPSFCLIQGPPYYHTDHDTVDKISRDGLEAAVDFHLRLFDVIGALAPGNGVR